MGRCLLPRRARYLTGAPPWFHRQRVRHLTSPFRKTLLKTRLQFATLPVRAQHTIQRHTAAIRLDDQYGSAVWRDGCDAAAGLSCIQSTDTERRESRKAHEPAGADRPPSVTGFPLHNTVRGAVQCQECMSRPLRWRIVICWYIWSRVGFSRYVVCSSPRFKLTCTHRRGREAASHQSNGDGVTAAALPLLASLAALVYVMERTPPRLHSSRAAGAPLRWRRAPGRAFRSVPSPPGWCSLHVPVCGTLVRRPPL